MILDKWTRFGDPKKGIHFCGAWLQQKRITLPMSPFVSFDFGENKRRRRQHRSRKRRRPQSPWDGCFFSKSSMGKQKRHGCWPAMAVVTWFISSAPKINHRIHGTGIIFTYIDPMKIKHSWIGKDTVVPWIFNG